MNSAPNSHFHSEVLSILESKKRRKKSMLKLGGVSLNALLLAACGGGSPAPSTPAAPLGPDYTENPTGTFTGRDNANLTLDQGSANTNLTVNSKDGNDTIITGAGHDVINGAGGNDVIDAGNGNDIIRANLGADIVDAGAGDDIIVIVGTTGAGEYAETSITNPGGSGLDVSSVLTLAELNGHTASDAEAGETIDGGAGNDTIMIYGTADLTGITIVNVANIQVNSTLTLTATQFAEFTNISGDGSSVLNIINDTGSDPLIIDLSSTSLADIGTLTTTGDVQIIVSSAADLAGIENIVRDGNLTLVLADDGTGTNNFNLSDLAAVIDSVDVIEVEQTVTLVVDDTTSVSGLTVSGMGGSGTLVVSDAGSDGVYIENYSQDLTVINSGTLTSAYYTMDLLHYLSGEASGTTTFINSGDIISTVYDAVFLDVYHAGTVTFINEAGGTLTGDDAGAVLFHMGDGSGASTSFTNAGTIESTSWAGVYAYVDHDGAFSFTNEATGTISSDEYAVDIGAYYYTDPTNATFDFTNAGTLTGGTSGILLDTTVTSTITNTATGVINTTSGDDTILVVEVYSTDYLLTFTNAGLIDGGVYIDADSTLFTNTGTITGDVTFGIGDDVFDGAAGTVQGAIEGGGGNDTITTGTGADVLVFDDAWGDDTITNFEDGIDLLDFSNGTLVFADLTITQSGADTLIEDESGNSISLTGLTSTDITVDDFIF